eukprot:UC1_evm1s1800
MATSAASEQLRLPIWGGLDINAATDEERKCMAEMRTLCDSEEEDKREEEGQQPEERNMLARANDEMLLRFARARKLKANKAVKMLRRHMEWLRELEMAPADVTQKDLERSLPAGCWRFLGVNDQGQPVLLIRVSLWNPHQYDVDEYVRLICYFNMLAYGMMEHGVSRWVVIFDMAGWSLWMAKYLSFIKQLVSITQDQFPERLASVFLMGSPWIFKASWKLIQPWLDKVTASKVHFVSPGAEKMLSMVPVEILPEEYGGHRLDHPPIPNAPGLAEDLALDPIPW